MARVDFIVDMKEWDRGLRTLNRELHTQTRRRLAAIARRERDAIRADFTVGPPKGGHAYRAVTSGAHGLSPYISLKRRHPRYPYVGWLVFGGTRRRRYRHGVAVDRQPRFAPKPDGWWFYPGVKRARAAATDEVFQVLQDAKRKAGFR